MSYFLSIEDGDLSSYFQEVSKFKILDPQEEREYLLEFFEIKNSNTPRTEEIKNILFMSCARLVINVAKKFRGNGLSFLDIIQEGNIGLIMGIDKFDPNKYTTRLSTYAIWWVRQSIIKAISEKSRTIRLPTHKYNSMLNFNKAQKILSENLGREPNDKEISDFTGYSIETILELMFLSKDISSLDKNHGEDNLTLGDVIEDNQISIEDMVISNFVQKSIRKELFSLDIRERDIIQMRFGIDFSGGPLTLEETGEKLNLTRERIRQIQQRAIKKLEKNKTLMSLVH